MTTLAAHLLRHAHNNHWSNYRLHTACAALSGDEYRARRPSFFGSIHATLNHILVVDLIYLGRLKGEERVPDDCVELHADRARLHAEQAAADRELIGFCAGQDAASLDSTVRFTRANAQRYTETVASVLGHLFVHQVHHRGQVHGLLSATDVAPPQLDEFFLQGDLPLREEELRVLGLPSA